MTKWAIFVATFGFVFTCESLIPIPIGIILWFASRYRDEVLLDMRYRRAFASLGFFFFLLLAIFSVPFYLIPLIATGGQYFFLTLPQLLVTVFLAAIVYRGVTYFSECLGTYLFGYTEWDMIPEKYPILPEPEYTSFVPPKRWKEQCRNCGARIKEYDCWNCGYDGELDE